MAVRFEGRLSTEQLCSPVRAAARSCRLRPVPPAGEHPVRPPCQPAPAQSLPGWPALSPAQSAGDRGHRLACVCGGVGGQGMRGVCVCVRGAYAVLASEGMYVGCACPPLSLSSRPPVPLSALSLSPPAAPPSPFDDLHHLQRLLPVWDELHLSLNKVLQAGHLQG